MPDLALAVLLTLLGAAFSSVDAAHDKLRRTNGMKWLVFFSGTVLVGFPYTIHALPLTYVLPAGIVFYVATLIRFAHLSDNNWRWPNSGWLVFDRPVDKLHMFKWAGFYAPHVIALLSLPVGDFYTYHAGYAIAASVGWWIWSKPEHWR